MEAIVEMIWGLQPANYLESTWVVNTYTCMSNPITGATTEPHLEWSETCECASE